MASALPALAGCANAPADTFPVPVHEAFERLRDADMDAFRRARQCGILIHFARQAVTDESVTWRVASGGRDMVRFTVRLIPVGTGETRIAIEIPPDPNGGEPYDGDKFYPRPALHQPLRPAVQELAAAALEQRPFDVSRTPNSGKHESVCNVQRAGLEAGHRFAVDDRPGSDTPTSRRIQADEDAAWERELAPETYGQPDDEAAGSDGW